jgi:adenine phosphoribosyltransferase
MADAVDLSVPLSQSERSDWLKSIIRDIPDFPTPGILFRDITPLLKDARAFQIALAGMAEPFKDAGIEQVVGVESRGFIFGAPLSLLLNAGFVPVRKFGKLPADTIHVEYALEYGSNTVEIHTDAIHPGQKVLVVDDLLATGGTVSAALELVKRLGGEVVGIAFLVELTALQGRGRLQGHNIFSLIQY